MDEAYSYTDLPANHFRLLEVHGFDQAKRLSCSLHAAALDSHSEYDAISYAWNGETPSVPVVCNSRNLLVTPSLYHGLSTFYQHGPSRNIWADAICINQANDDEKAYQVPLMGRIYAGAKCVLVWLGQPGAYTDLAISSVPWLVVALETAPDSMVLTDASLIQFNLPKANDPLWKGIDDLFSRPWFKRLWIVQEVALAREILVFCGSKSTSWELLSALADHVGRVGLTGLARESTKVDPSKSDGFDAMMVPNFIRTYQKRGQGYPLWNLCHYARSRDTSEPVDKVYAMLSLTDQATRDMIVVDYSPESRKNYWKAYVDLVSTLLKADTTLFLLQISSSKERPAGLPSWCPNLNSTSSCIMLARGFYGAGGELGNGAGDEDRAYSGLASPDKTRISLRGFCVDEIELVVQSLWSWDQDYEKQRGSEGCAARGFQWMNECRTHASSVPLVQGEAPEDLVRTLIADILHNPPSHAPNRVELLQSVSDATVYLQILRDNENAAIYLKEAELFRAQRYLRALDLACRGRKFFRTKEGRMGLGPLETSAGDCVFVFAGAQVPFLFNFDPSGECYRLIGEAYIHGIMHGQALHHGMGGSLEKIKIEVV